MPIFKNFYVAPLLPPKLEFLQELAFNLWWSWNIDAISLFRRLDEQLWETTNHNPVMLLSLISQERLLEMENDEGFITSMEEVRRQFRKYLKNEGTWFKNQPPAPSNFLVAYFSAEYGLTECLPLYSGGLGVLAGDHLKTSSELGIPVVGVGILYQKGYFKQFLDAEGWQHENYTAYDFGFLPIRPVRNEKGLPFIISVEFPCRNVFVQVWKVDIGRNRLFLLDTNIEQNSREDQDLTDYLYGGDSETRLCQEIILGIGGMRALLKMGIEPTVCHMNEGHCAFLTLEKIRHLIEQKGLNFKEAYEAVSSSCVFTTHTPVPAGSDYFSPELIEKYFSDYIKRLGISLDEFLSLGKTDPKNDKEHFCMTVLALRLSSFRNAVSRLHEYTSKNLWKGVWQNAMLEEIPITHITNGINLKSWVSFEFRNLFDRYLGPKWAESSDDTEVWKKVDSIPNEELWRTHERRRERLIAFARQRIIQQMKRINAPLSEIESVASLLNPKALTIGIARRFASYKRADLIFKDIERLGVILSDNEKPVQIIFAGKAHPKDKNGKEIIKKIIGYCKSEPFKGKVVFLEDYDMNVARYLVQGCDIWLNNPRRPLEASGTSGMKAAVNGVLNFSILDGWWDEAYSKECGWTIGNGETYEDENYGDIIESKYLLDTLEKEIIPLFYDRGKDMMPRGWIEMVKNSIKKLSPVFSTHRMLKEYMERFYIPADLKNNSLSKNDFSNAKSLAQWKERVARGWSAVNIVNVKADFNGRETKIGDNINFEVEVALCENIKPEDIKVEIIHGPMDISGNLMKMQKSAAIFSEKTQNGTLLFKGILKCSSSGKYGYAIRVIPNHPLIEEFCDFPLVVWHQ